MRSRRPVTSSPTGPSSTYRRVVRLCVLLGVGCLAVVSVVAFLLSQRLADQEALRDAADHARGMAHGVAAPLVTEQARSGDPAGLVRLGRALDAHMAEGGVSLLVLWDEDGRVLWASDRELVGRTFALSVDARTALASQHVVAHLPDTAEPHAAGLHAERGELEAYVGSVGADGRPFLFEAYMPADRIDEHRAALLPELLGIGVGAVVLLLALTVPLALRLARRVDEAQQRRTRSLGRSVESWRHQRLLLAQDLHDGVIQDMAAISIGLSLLEGRSLDDAASGDVLTRVADSARRGEASLRSIVLDLAPRQLETRGLAEAVVDLARQHRGQDLDITVSYSRDVRVPDGSGILAFRVVREGLRNVVRHAAATSVLVDVRAGAQAETIEVEVLDDGAVPPAEGALASGQGLRLLAETIEDVGGSLSLGRVPGGGTRLAAVIPFVRTQPAQA